MRHNKVKILCQGFKWDRAVIGADFYKMSFVADGANPAAFTDEIDLMPYVRRGSLGDIEWNMEELAISEDGNMKEQFFLSSDFSFEVIAVRAMLQFEGELKEISFAEWFRCKEDTSYNKYTVKVQYNFGTGGADKWKTIWRGVVEQDCVEYTEGRDNNNAIIKIKAYGFEKQIKEYLENLKLPAMGEPFMEKTKYSIIFGAEEVQVDYIELWKWFSYMNLKTNQNSFDYNTYLNANLPGHTPEYGQAYYRIVRWAHMYRDLDGHLAFYQSGYDELPEETAWSFLMKLCTAMGWVIFFAMKQPPDPDADTRLTFYLRDRYSIQNQNIFTLERDKISKPGITWSHGVPEPTVRCIIIPNGEIKGGYDRKYINEAVNSMNLSSPYFWGKRIIPLWVNDLMKATMQEGNYTGQNVKTGSLHFNGCDYNTSDKSYIGFGRWFISYAQEINKDDKNYLFKTINGLGIVDSYFYPNEAKILNLSRKDVLILNAGESSIGTTIFPHLNGRHETGDFQTQGLDWRAMWFTGNYGAMVGLEVDATVGGQHIHRNYTYQDFIRSDIWRNNFLKFLENHSNLNCELEYNEVLFNPMCAFRLKTEAGASVYDTYSLSKLKINLEKETTKLTLIK